jgi:GNAT superfamily N-acetyltransferase
LSARFRIEKLEPNHDRRGFDCGEPSLNRYFAELVTQDVRRLIAKCYIIRELADARVAGYYTLAASTIGLSELPADIAKRLPRYPSVPAVRIGRLAVDRHYQGAGLGAALLADALGRALGADVAAFAAVVDAIDDGAELFYRRYGFINFGDRPRQLFLPLATFTAGWGARTKSGE